MKEIKGRLMRRADFTAETLEAEAAKLPPSQKAYADNLREMARNFRQSTDHTMVRVWEEPPTESDS